MGRTKQLLPFGDSTILETVISRFRSAGLDGLVVVTNQDVQAALGLTDHARFDVVIQPDPDAEMLDSILLGVRCLIDVHQPTGADGILVCPGDMPAVDTRLVTACADAYRSQGESIVVATHQNKRGHPVVFPVSMTAELESFRGVGLRGLLDAHGDRLVPVAADPASQRDIDTPQDYRNAVD